MPTNITPVPQFTNTNPTRPVPGEKVAMETGTAPLAPLLQIIIDRLQYVRGITWGQLIGADVFSVDPAGTATSFTARLNAFEAMSIQDTNSVFWPVYNTAETTFTQANYAGGTLPADSAVYAYLGIGTDGTTLVKELSTTAPGDSRIWMSSNANRRRWVGTFVTDGSGNPLPVMRVKGRSLFRRSAITSVEGLIAAGGLRALNRTTVQGTKTDLGLALRVPATARAVLLDLTVIGNGTGPESATLELFVDTDTASRAIYLSSPDGTRQRLTVEVPLAAGSRVVKYTLAVSGGLVLEGDVDLLGYVE